MKTEKHDLAYYMALPYTKLLRPDEDGDIVARIAELPGCSAHGENEAVALKNLEEAQRLWLEDSIEAGDPVPEPERRSPFRAESGFNVYREVCIVISPRRQIGGRQPQSACDVIAVREAQLTRS